MDTSKQKGLKKKRICSRHFQTTASSMKEIWLLQLRFIFKTYFRVAVKYAQITQTLHLRYLRTYMHLFEYRI